MSVYAKCIDGQQEADKRRIEWAPKGEEEEATKPELVAELCRPIAMTSEIKGS